MVKQQHQEEEQGCVLPALNGPETMEKAMESKDDQVEDGKNGSSSSSSSSSSPLRIHVLVVDDSPIDRKIIEKLLTKAASYKVTAVDSGRKALEVLDSVNNNIDLIFTDYCMPEMSGYELLRQVKESNVFGDKPVVIMSSENVPSRIERCLKDGAEEFILKPVRLADARRLSSFVHDKPLKLQSTVEQPPSVISKNKRKFSSDGFQTEARLRLSGVIVA